MRGKAQLMSASAMIRALWMERILNAKMIRTKTTLFHCPCVGAGHVGQPSISFHSEDNKKRKESKKMKQRRLMILRNAAFVDPNFQSTSLNRAEKEKELASCENLSDQIMLEDLLKKRFFYGPSFEIHGAISGFYDWGPLGCGMKTNLLNVWRQHFILEEQMLEVDSSIFTPESVLRASGHADRFSDCMVQDSKTGESFRLSHLIKEHLEDLIYNQKIDETARAECNDIIFKLDGLTKEEMTHLLQKFQIKNPKTGNELSEAVDFNLMFRISAGPTGLSKGFLRPETAQGIFVNFKKLLDFNQGHLPFAAAQIGTAFRNEISPRSGLIRLREFLLAEVEHFVDPNCKDHPKFKTVENVQLLLYTRGNQLGGKPAELISIKEAFQQNIFDNQSLAYFIARIQTFLVKVGIDAKRIRFRQHLADELSHYASDCWDAECHTSYGWIECVGCSDRSCYDLNRHLRASRVTLTAERKLKEPKMVEIAEVHPNRPLIAKLYGKDAKQITAALENLTEESLFSLQNQLNETGKYVLQAGEKTWALSADMVSVTRYEKLLHVEQFVPHVVEPSFGVGRIIYTIFEHTFITRSGNKSRKYLALPPSVAPVKCAILPLGSNEEFEPLIEQLRTDLTKVGLTVKVDSTNRSIGRRYIHMDQIGVPYGVTIDFDSFCEPHTATLRERDSTAQVRVPLTELPKVVKSLVSGDLSWEKVEAAFPKFKQQQKTQAAEERILPI